MGNQWTRNGIGIITQIVLIITTLAMGTDCHPHKYESESKQVDPEGFLSKYDSGEDAKDGQGYGFLEHFELRGTEGVAIALVSKLVCWDL